MTKRSGQPEVMLNSDLLRLNKAIWNLQILRKKLSLKNEDFILLKRKGQHLELSKYVNNEISALPIFTTRTSR